MGATFSHGAWDGSYSGFSALRSLVFRLAGHGDLDTVEGFTDPIDEDDPDGETKPGRNLRDLIPKSDGLYPLFEMDDTGGLLRNSALPPLARRLRQIVAESPEQVDRVYEGEPELTTGRITIYAPEVGRTWRELLTQFADGCERAHKAREDLTWE